MYNNDRDGMIPVIIIVVLVVLVAVVVCLYLWPFYTLGALLLLWALGLLISGTDMRLTAVVAGVGALLIILSYFGVI